MLVWIRVVSGGGDDCEGDDERGHGIEAGREVLVDWDVFVVLMCFWFLVIHDRWTCYL
jgi:hypothetical protein